MPYSPRCPSPEKYSADSRSVLLGTVPVLMQLPPGTPARSTTATRLPKYAACAPAFSPAGPQPMITRSNFSLSATVPSVFLHRAYIAPQLARSRQLTPLSLLDSTAQIVLVKNEVPINKTGGRGGSRTKKGAEDSQVIDCTNGQNRENTAE